MSEIKPSKLPVRHSPEGDSGDVTSAATPVCEGARTRPVDAHATDAIRSIPREELWEWVPLPCQGRENDYFWNLIIFWVLTYWSILKDFTASFSGLRSGRGGVDWGPQPFSSTCPHPLPTNPFHSGGVIDKTPHSRSKSMHHKLYRYFVGLVYSLLTYTSMTWVVFPDLILICLGVLPTVVDPVRSATLCVGSVTVQPSTGTARSIWTGYSSLHM